MKQTLALDPILSLFGEPPYHLLAMSGGKDSTALALVMQQRMPDLHMRYYCTPTGNELPDMIAWWNHLGTVLGSRIIPIMEMTLQGCIHKNKMLPNFRIRFCTRQIKIEPARRVLAALRQRGPVTHYVGLRADEPTRLGGLYDDLGIESRYPLREFGMGLTEVRSVIKQHELDHLLPARTDCALCYHQRIGEWYLLWKEHKDQWDAGVELETHYKQTFRTPGRDTWPSAMSGLAAEFARGRIPKGMDEASLAQRDSMAAGACRVCSL